MHVFADGISKVTLSNGNLRIMLTNVEQMIPQLRPAP
ncbi:hypothetical protein Dthio_PD0498 [Desulfonatronospira thiodismutans ASO3-1]|uniref:Uncharacterized protein n=1 Tax=Desulfonatronospira thiodismutans ASO3-1 TaxID=555779 RepID=D6SR59_9BACT|nr:hypothetical protein Dthio_PD0498 [Desulfonatronospira thiodismutans ASO3-1]